MFRFLSVAAFSFSTFFSLMMRSEADSSASLSVSAMSSLKCIALRLSSTKSLFSIFWTSFRKSCTSDIRSYSSCWASSQSCLAADSARFLMACALASMRNSGVTAITPFRIVVVKSCRIDMNFWLSRIFSLTCTKMPLSSTPLSLVMGRSLGLCECRLDSRLNSDQNSGMCSSSSYVSASLRRFSHTFISVYTICCPVGMPVVCCMCLSSIANSSCAYSRSDFLDISLKVEGRISICDPNGVEVTEYRIFAQGSCTFLSTVACNALTRLDTNSKPEGACR
mmetsp:Transcript_33551/g.56338  ORF Transcript_33551/g.56338 Transcript_33551/m.56338 type:complete len:280 (-) Transcript_33551:271-1110(-)